MLPTVMVHSEKPRSHPQGLRQWIFFPTETQHRTLYVFLAQFVLFHCKLAAVETPEESRAEVHIDAVLQ